MKLYWQSVTSCLVPLCSWYNTTVWVDGGGQAALARKSATKQHKQPLFLSTAATGAVIKASYDFAVQTGNLFLSMTITLIWPQASLLFFCERGFLIHHYSCEETTISGPRLSWIKTRYCPVWAMYTNTIHQQVWEEIFFFPLQRDVTFGECGVSVREQKLLARGHSACRRISSLGRGKKRSKPWYSWLCRSIYKAELIAPLCNLIIHEFW